MRRRYIDVFSPADRDEDRYGLIRQFLPRVPAALRANPTWEIDLVIPGCAMNDADVAGYRDRDVTGPAPPPGVGARLAGMLPGSETYILLEHLALLTPYKPKTMGDHLAAKAKAAKAVAVADTAAVDPAPASAQRSASIVAPSPSAIGIAGDQPRTARARPLARTTCLISPGRSGSWTAGFA